MKQSGIPSASHTSRSGRPSAAQLTVLRRALSFPYRVANAEKQHWMRGRELRNAIGYRRAIGQAISVGGGETRELTGNLPAFTILVGVCSHDGPRNASNKQNEL